MSLFLSLLRQSWKYRFEIAMGIKAIASLWKNAQDLTREYIRKRIKERLAQRMAVVSVELLLLLGAFTLNLSFPVLLTRLIASVVLWAITIYNIYELIFVTYPEIREVYRVLKSKIGYTVKHIFRISLVTELMQWNVIFLFLCLFLAISSRTVLAATFSYLAPWGELLDSIAPLLFK